MAQALSKIQKELLARDLCLKVYDAYRPQRAVDFFIQWMEAADTPCSKRYHYPKVSKSDLNNLSYLSHRSSHSLGTGVDVTIVPLCGNKKELTCPDNFLGYFDPESLDMGVGYLAFDASSGSGYKKLLENQQKNRELLARVMIMNGFEPLETEFWHYYYKRDRNLDTYFNFSIQDNLNF
jgi:zinc D-Ala-D-Ala dipeptidase